MEPSFGSIQMVYLGAYSRGVPSGFDEVMSIMSLVLNGTFDIESSVTPAYNWAKSLAAKPIKLLNWMHKPPMRLVT